jgi:YD repeat-containing protein
VGSGHAPLKLGKGSSPDLAPLPPTAIIAPGGQRTAFEVHPSSCQTLKITNPAGEEQEFTYDDGLMTSMKDARDHLWEFTYDSLGRLIRDDDPAGGYKTLSPEATEHG